MNVHELLYVLTWAMNVYELVPETWASYYVSMKKSLGTFVTFMSPFWIAVCSWANSAALDLERVSYIVEENIL